MHGSYIAILCFQKTKTFMKGSKVITLVKHIMTQNLITISYETKLYEAHQIMEEKRIRHLPVVDANENVIGIISQRDLNCVPDSKHLTAGLMMTSEVEYVDYNTPLRKAILIMLEKKISSLLVCDTAEVVVGIVTTDDILWHLAHFLSYEVKEKSHPVGLTSVLDAAAVGL